MLRISFSIIFSIFIDRTRVNSMDEETCLVDSGTTKSILREIKYFQTLTKSKGNVLAIARRDAVIVGSGRAIITLPMGTTITIEDALLYSDLTHTLLSYKDIHKNGCWRFLMTHLPRQHSPCKGRKACILLTYTY